MAYSSYQVVSLGSGKAGLATVGYQLVDSNGANVGTRVTAGVQDIAGGQYGATLTIPTGFRGRVKWDSGEAVPIVASSTVNPEDSENLLAAVAQTPEAVFAYLKGLIP